MAIIKSVRGLVLGALLAGANSQKSCNLRDHMKHSFGEPNPETNTMKAFFYYPNEELCDITPGKSEKLP